MTHQSAKLCPRCGLGLYVGHTHNVAMHGCGRCGGLWLDRQGADYVVQAVCTQALGLADSAAQHAAEQKVDTSAEGIPCPECRQALARTRVPAAWIDVDVCALHGTWFDCGELQKVAQASQRQHGDWRQQPPAPSAGAPVAAAAGAVGAGGIVAGVGQQLGSLAESNPVATEIAGELAVDGAFAIIGGLLGALLE